MYSSEREVSILVKIIISNAHSTPIYEQIAAQIRSQVVSGEIESGFSLPSIRALAKDLQVSVITTKRAYEDLEKEGYIDTVPGKGSFIASQNTPLIKERKLNKLEETIDAVLQMAKDLDMTKEQLFELIELLHEEASK